jgi:hypothetical protein
MARLLLNLRHVPDDEVEEIRDLLTEHEILFYETQPSRWGISAGGIWLNRDDDLAQARALMADYQAERAQRKREEFEAARETGEVPGFWQRVRQQPVASLMGLVFIVALLALMVAPFWRL